MVFNGSLIVRFVWKLENSFKQKVVSASLQKVLHVYQCFPSVQTVSGAETVLKPHLHTVMFTLSRI